MLHKISDFCKKIDSIKAQADKLYNLKYNYPKAKQSALPTTRVTTR